MRVLFIGDIFGKPGRQALHGLLPRLRRELVPDVVIVNVENIAGGAGVTIDICQDLRERGVDVMTTGNHVWDRREIIDYFEREPRLLRPLNFPPSNPGHGVVRLEHLDMAVMNLQGRVFMRANDDPFRSIEAAIQDNPVRFTIIDFHAEATAEKKALGYYLDGRVSALVGTHTHVQTADARVLPKGTAFISDVGMTGPIESIIGNDPERTLQRYLTQMPVAASPATGPAELSAVVIDLDDETGLATGIQRIQERWGN